MVVSWFQELQGAGVERGRESCREVRGGKEVLADWAALGVAWDFALPDMRKVVEDLRTVT